MSKGKSFGTSFIAGVVLLPAAAILSVALIGKTPPEEPVDVAVVETTIAPVVVQAEAPASPFLSDLDIWTACVPDAAGLIERETAGTITPVEDAALDALREICAEEGIPLDGPPPPPPVSRTIYVNGPPAAPSVAVAGTTDTTAQPSTDTTAVTGTTLPPATTPPTTTAGTTAAGETQYLDARAAALSAIDEAVAANGKADKISEARSQLAEAQSKATSNDYWGALEKALEAERNAQEAISEAGD